MIKRWEWLEIHGAVVLFGLAGLFGKWLPISPVLLVLGRVAFASLALAAIIVLTGALLRSPAGVTWPCWSPC